MEKRIRLLRKDQKLTQERFGEVLGIKTSTVNGYESGRRKPSRASITDMCEKFGVSEAWLTDGIGEMYGEVKDEVLAKIINEVTENQLIRAILTTWVKLDQDDRNKFVDFIDDIIDSYNGGPNATQRFINEHMVKQDQETEEQAQ